MIQVQVSPETEQRLGEAARARGIPLAEYASQIITSSFACLEDKSPTPEELEEFFVHVAAHANAVPDLSDDAYSRESIYQDHD
jgi:hypothetical protein